MPRPELFHRIHEASSAKVRRHVSAAGLDVEMRNVFYESNAQALAAHGGSETPALWDGSRLHVGADAVLDALSKNERPRG